MKSMPPLDCRRLFEAIPRDISSDAMIELRGTYGHDGAREIVQAMVAELPKQREELRRALDAGDLEVLKRLAHTFKSCSLMLGASALGQACEVQERLADEGGADAEALRELMARFERLVQSARGALAAD